MVNMDRKTTEYLELRSQEYSVLITDSRRTSSGSGVLYCSQNSSVFYIFTCAHVLDELTDSIEIFFLLPIDRETENYKICHFYVNRSQIVYSPIDEVTEVNGVKYHSVDVAVICIPKDDGLSLEPTCYYAAEARRNTPVFAQGFPGGCLDAKELPEALDLAHGTVLHNIAGKQTFLFRTEDAWLDAGNRVYEMQGFSGSPVWNGDDSVLSILGLLASGSGETVYRGKLSAVKIDAVISIMKNHFDELLEFRLSGIPEEDVSGGNEEFVPEFPVPSPENRTIYDEWLGLQTEKVRAYIDELKMKKAIDAAREAIGDDRFNRCSDDKIKFHMQHLLYCYEICLMDSEYEELEREMNRRKLLNGHEPLRWLTSCFGKGRFQETIDYADELLEGGNGSAALLQIAGVFRGISRAYTENAPVEDTLFHFLDEHENLKIETDGNDTASLIYQMTGYVYGEYYKQYTKSVRCLNRSYRLGHNKVVLETLACSYYFLALQNGIRDDNTVDMEKVDRAALYKARECFLHVLDLADELYLSGLFKRDGGVLFNTFFFLMDTYRILTVYPLMRKYMPLSDKRDVRDFELKYAKTLCRGGNVDLSVFKELTAEDRALIETLGVINGFINSLDFRHPASLKIPQLGISLKNLIGFAEENLERIDPREQIGVRVAIINLYGWGRRIFGWEVSEGMEKHMVSIRETGNSGLITAMENFKFENSNPPALAEGRYIKSWEQNPSFELWQEILQFYKRHWMLEKADAMFRDLFEKHQEYVKNEPEYAYRAYIDYIVGYQRDIKDALRFYIAHRDEMQDLNIAGFWELELMMYTNSFNEPERFDTERLLFVEQGLLPIEEYHRTSLIAYMCNLNSKKAAEHFDITNPNFGFFPAFAGIPQLTPEGAHFLVWQKKLPPHMEPHWNGMLPSRVHAVQSLYNGEDWRLPVADITSGFDFSINKNIVIDGWGLFLIAAECKMELLAHFDIIYVTHFSITRMMDEMCHYRNEYLESALAYLETAGNVKLQSPDFEHQLLVRDKTEYYEPGSSVAMALEAGCPAVIGEPMLGKDLIANFRHVIVRPCDFGELVGE